jgi:hypothetical protein
MSINNIQNLIAAGTVMNTTLNGQAVSLQKIYNFSIQIVFTGTPTGSFKLQGSNDSYAIPANTNPNLPVNWTDVANSSFTVSAAGNVMWDYGMCGFDYVRVVYTDTSSGSSTAIITVSTFNGK